MKFLLLPLLIFIISGKPGLKKQGVIDSFRPEEQSPLKTPIRIRGLERIYFQPVSDTKNITGQVKVLLPARLTQEKFQSDKYIYSDIYSDQDFYQVNVQDFKIPINGSDIWLREVRDHSHPRISKLWWAIYDKAKRCDTWYYTSYTSGTERKVLSNYSIDSILVSGQDSLTFRIWGQMARPGGYWQIKGINLTFSYDNANLVLDRVQNVFSILHGYNVGDTLEIRTEKVVGAQYQQRALDPVTIEILDSCNLADLLSDEPRQYSWDELRRGSFCIAQNPNTKVTYRRFDEPSFIERGWQSEK